MDTVLLKFTFRKKNKLNDRYQCGGGERARKRLDGMWRMTVIRRVRRGPEELSRLVGQMPGRLAGRRRESGILDAAG